MNNFTDMKIEVNADQPLEEIVRELERNGYKRQAWSKHQKEVVATFKTGVYSNFNYFYNDTHNPTTLAELKEM